MIAFSQIDFIGIYAYLHHYSPSRLTFIDLIFIPRLSLAFQAGIMFLMSDDPILPLFKALADPERIRILARLQEEACSVEEIAAELRLTPKAVSRHLSLLTETGLVSALSLPNGTRFKFQRQPLTDALQTLARTPAPPPNLSEDASEFDAKTLRDFFKEDKLKTIPVQPRKRDVILRFLAQQFTPEVRYPEKEVNEMLTKYHPDFATLRRALVDSRLMTRENNIYWRIRLGRLI